MTNKLLSLPTNTSSYEAIVENNCYYVDKTSALKTVFQDDLSQVLLITRPPYFGKSLTMSMFNSFLALNTDDPNDLSRHIELFKDKEIYKDNEFCDKFMGKYPVIFISFKEVRGKTWKIAYEKTAKEIYSLTSGFCFLKTSTKLDEYDKQILNYLLDFDFLSDPENLVTLGFSLWHLTKLLYKHFDKRVIILIDDYETPLVEASKYGYYREMEDLMASLYGSALKDNDKYVQKAVLAGVIRPGSENFITAINNLCSNTIFSGFNALATAIGFTKKETDELLDYYGLSEFKAEVQENYGGYNFNHHEIYNPYGVVSFCKATVNTQDKSCVEVKSYQHSTSLNAVLKEFLAEILPCVSDDLQTLVDGGAVSKNLYVFIDHEWLENYNRSDFWSFQVYSGYLTPSKGAVFDIDHEPIDLVIPNTSVLKAFRENILENFTSDKAQLAYANDIIKAIFDGKADELKLALNSLLKGFILVKDFSSTESDESYYQGFLNDVFSSQKDYLENYASNKELGEDFSVITFTSLDEKTAVIIEIKQTDKKFDKAKLANLALEQIEHKEYYQDHLDYSSVLKIYCYGICFYKKSCSVAFKEIKK